jgi:hypothetical protein
MDKLTDIVEKIEINDLLHNDLLDTLEEKQINVFD